MVVEGHAQHRRADARRTGRVITPWNAPFMLSTWKLAPALAAGNTVILKPAEWSPLSCSLLADLTVEAGFPAGVFNLVQGIGEEVGPPLVGDPRVKPDQLHRLARDGPPHRPGGGREHRAVHRRARRQGPAGRVRRRRPRRRRARRRPGSTTTPDRSASPAPACSSRRRCATTSSPGSSATSTPRARRQPRPGDDDRPDDPPRPRRARRRASSSGPAPHGDTILRGGRPRRRLAARRADA